jgi:polyphosphate kinase
MSGEKRGGKLRGGAEAERLKGKEYERELAKLHVELVKLQEWVRHKGLKVAPARGE